MGLKEKRIEKGWTLKELAEKSGVHLVKIQQIESGRIKPENMTLRNATKLADALECSPKDLMQ
jgi:transcriptional regulator with XRE-family HTH domain